MAPEDVEARVTAIAALRKIPGKAMLPRFIAALRDGDLAVAKTATMGLRDRQADLAPLRALLRDKDPNLRWQACTLAWWFQLTELGPDLARTVRNDPDPMVRAEAAWGLQCCRSEAAARALLVARKDANGMVAHYAAWNLRVIQARCPDLPALKGRTIVPPPLSPEPPLRPGRAAPAAVDNAAGFDRFACSTPLPTCRAVLGEPPKVDGRLKACYGRSPAGTFVHIDGRAEVPERQTQFYVACSRRAVHVLIRCQYQDAGELAAKCAADGGPVYADNSVELFLDPTGTGAGRYFQICLNTRNVRCQGIARSPGWHVWQPEGFRPQPWEPAGLQTAVRVEGGWWNAEFAVPYAALGLKPGRVNKLWRMNVTRSAHLPMCLEVTSWCDLGGLDAHRADRFGWLWLDAGGVANADARVFAAVPLPLEKGLRDWTVLRGRFELADGGVVSLAGGSALRWDRPIPFEQFEVTAEIKLAHQIRFMFAGDRENSVTGFDGAYLRMINEAHFAHAKGWRDWSPPFPGMPTIYKEVYPRLPHSRWCRSAVRVCRRRCQLLLDGAVLIEMPRPPMPARYLGLAFAGGGALRKLCLHPLPG